MINFVLNKLFNDHVTFSEAVYEFSASSRTRRMIRDLNEELGEDEEIPPGISQIRSTYENRQEELIAHCHSFRRARTAFYFFAPIAGISLAFSAVTVIDSLINKRASLPFQKSAVVAVFAVAGAAFTGRKVLKNADIVTGEAREFVKRNPDEDGPQFD